MPAIPSLRCLRDLSIVPPVSEQKKRGKGFKIKMGLFLLTLFCIALISTISFSEKKHENLIVSIRKPHPDFVGRRSYLDQLQAVLVPQLRKWSRQDATRVMVIWGKGGYGKTELAISFANRNLSQFSLVWNFNCDTKANLYQSYRLLANRLGISGENDSFIRLKEKVHDYLEHHAFSRPFLLIFDNVEREQMDYPKRGGSVLMTSQKKLAGEKVQVLLDHLTPNEAIELLSKAGKDDKPEQAMQLAEALEYIPLLVNSATHYIQATPGSNCSNYLELLNQERSVCESKDANHRYFKTLFHSWQAPFNKLEKHFPLAAEWLRIFAYLNPENIPEKWFRTWVQKKSELGVEEAFLEAKKLLKVLIRYGLVRYDAEKKMLLIHRFFQKIIQIKRADLITEDLALATEFLGLYFDIYCYAKKKTWEEGGFWLTHALEMQRWLEKTPILASFDQALLYQGIGEWFVFHDRPEKAHIAYQKELEMKKEVFPEDHFEIGMSYMDLAWAKLCNGFLEEGLIDATYAEKVVCSKKYPLQWATVLNTKGLILYRLGKYEESIACHEKALKARRKHLGNIHIDVARTLNNMGISLNRLRRFEQASCVLEEAEEIVQQTAGVHHPLYALALENQCHILIGLKQYREAIIQAGKAIILRQKALRQEHADLVYGWVIIGKAFFQMGETGLARYGFQNAFTISNRFIENNFRFKIFSQNMLGKCDFKEGKKEEGLLKIFDSINCAYTRRHVFQFRESYSLLLDYLEGEEEMFLSSLKMARELLGDEDPLVVKAKRILLKGTDMMGLTDDEELCFG